MKKLHQALFGSVIALGTGQAVALPFTGVDARSLAMGGTGVASGSIVNASTFNPALLAMARNGEDFNLSVSFGAIARDEDDLIGAVDDLQATDGAGNDLVQQFGNAVDAYDIAVNNSILAGATTFADVNTAVASEAAALQASSASLTSALDNLSNKPLELGAELGVNISMPGDTFGMSVFANSRGIAAGYATIDSADTGQITSIVNTVTSITTFTDYTALNIADPFAGGTNLASSFTLNGGVVTEVGVSMAMKVFGIAIGVTPKNVQIDTIESTSSVNTADTSIDNTGDSFSDVNFDVGVAVELGSLRIGAVGKNMIPQEYALTGSSTKVVLEPQLRAGVAYDAGWATFTVDQDLTENKGILSNAALDATSTTQYTAMGVEFDMALVQVRVGMRTDMTGNSEDVVTAGIGIHALVSFDVALAANDQGVEGILQLGVRW